MEKSMHDITDVTSHDEHLPEPEINKSPEHAAIVADTEEEHNLTFSQICKNHPMLIWWAFFYAMSAVGWGFDAQVNGAMISVASFRRDFGYIYQGEPVLPADWQTAFNIISAVGQFFGGFLCSWVADRIGRRPSLLIGVIVCSGGIFGEIFSHTRVAIGPLTCSEIAPVVLRGLSTAGINLGIAIGQLLSNAAVKGFGERTDHWAYRAPFVLQLFFVAFLLCGLPFAPESPWFLVRKGRYDEASVALTKLYGKNKDVSNKLNAMKASHLANDEVKERSYLDCFGGTNLIRTGISTGVFATQHMAGIIFVLGYSSYFFQLAGLDTSDSFDLGVGVTACGVLGNFLSWFVVNGYGRRKVFLNGLGILTFLLFLIGIMDVVPSGGAKWVQAASTVIYAFVYFSSIGAMAFVLLGEASTPALRGRTTALATATQAVCGIAMNFAIPYMVNPDKANMRGKVGFVFSGLSAISFVGAFLYLPELKGRSFDEIDIMFERRIAPRKMGQYVIHTEDM